MNENNVNKFDFSVDTTQLIKLNICIDEFKEPNFNYITKSNDPENYYYTNVFIEFHDVLTQFGRYNRIAHLIQHLNKHGFYLL